MPEHPTCNYCGEPITDSLPAYRERVPGGKLYCSEACMYPPRDEFEEVDDVRCV